MGDVLSTEPTPPSEVADVPPVVDDPILTALSKDKSDRQESILDLRRELEACLEELERDPTDDEPATPSPAPDSSPDTDPASDPDLDLDFDLKSESESESGLAADSSPSARTATQTQPDSAGGTTGTASEVEPTPASGRPDESDAATEAGSPGVGRTADAARSGSASHEPTATDPASDVETDLGTGTVSDTKSVADPGNWHYAVAGTIGLMLLGAGAGIDAFAGIGFFAFIYAYYRDLKELAGADIEWKPRRWLWLLGLMVYPITLPYYFYKRWQETTSNSG
jgi:serine/threonine protein kinase